MQICLDLLEGDLLLFYIFKVGLLIVNTEHL